jgi:hypothetical protein
MAYDGLKRPTRLGALLDDKESGLFVARLRGHSCGSSTSAPVLELACSASADVDGRVGCNGGALGYQPVMLGCHLVPFFRIHHPGHPKHDPVILLLRDLHVHGRPILRPTASGLQKEEN